MGFRRGCSFDVGAEVDDSENDPPSDSREERHHKDAKGGLCVVFHMVCVVRLLMCGAWAILQAYIVNTAENRPFRLLGVWLGFTGWFTSRGVSGRTSL